MKIEYIPKRFSREVQSLIETANKIITEYQAQGFDLTLRQLYYQFVARDLIPNKQKEYKRLGNIINDGRLAGLIDWEAIVDRTRNLQSLGHWASPQQIVESCARQFRIDKWANQPYRLEVWIEKDALTGVIAGVCDEHQVPYLSCRGYTSQSEMWSAAQRLRGYAEYGQGPVIIHLGDHDPSGIDMTRDIEDRLTLFGSGADVQRIALNMPQVKQYNPPPNPVKLTDSRTTGYSREHGTDECWELDALDPKVIAALIRKTILHYRDEGLWAKKLKEEERHKKTLATIANDLSEEDSDE